MASSPSSEEPAAWIRALNGVEMSPSVQLTTFKDGLRGIAAVERLDGQTPVVTVPENMVLEGMRLSQLPLQSFLAAFCDITYLLAF